MLIGVAAVPPFGAKRGWRRADHGVVMTIRGDEYYEYSTMSLEDVWRGLGQRLAHLQGVVIGLGWLLLCADYALAELG